MIKTIMLDFYGTLVEEDGIYIGRICREISHKSMLGSTPKEIGSFWHRRFSTLCNSSFGDGFKTQRSIELQSLRETVDQFQSSADPDLLSEILYNYWQAPKAFENTAEFLSKLELDSCVVSNIDNNDLMSALEHISFKPKHIITSESAAAYKPRPEMFESALQVMNLQPSEVIHVGDSFSSDIVGASSLGIRSVWINPKGKAASGNVEADYEVSDIIEVLPIIESFA